MKFSTWVILILGLGNMPLSALPIIEFFDININQFLEGCSVGSVDGAKSTCMYASLFYLFFCWCSGSQMAEGGQGFNCTSRFKEDY